MRSKISLPIQCLTLVFINLIGVEGAFSQVVHAGIKAGFNASWIHHDERQSSYDDLYRILPVPGYNAGIVASFKMKDRFFLHTELLYSTKGKLVKGKLDKTLKDRVTYNYIDLPLTYNAYFDAKIKLKNVKRFKWYVGIGPNFSYWLGGKGTIYNDEFAENEFPELEYKLRFGERGEELDEIDVIYIRDAKRFQLGVNIGGGILVEPVSGRKIMLDARFELGHTWLGNTRSADYVIPVSYKAENMKDRNMGLRLSIMYLFESNLDKKIRNKGKSTKKPRRL